MARKGFRQARRRGVWGERAVNVVNQSVDEEEVSDESDGEGEGDDDYLEDGGRGGGLKRVRLRRVGRMRRGLQDFGSARTKTLRTLIDGRSPQKGRLKGQP